VGKNEKMLINSQKKKSFRDIFRTVMANICERHEIHIEREMSFGVGKYFELGEIMQSRAHDLHFKL
jgi:hypothetical protein